MSLRPALLAVLFSFPLWASPNAQPVIPRAGETIEVSIVTGCVHLVLRLDRVRLRRGDQLGFGLANVQLLELCRGLGPICGA